MSGEATPPTDVTGSGSDSPTRNPLYAAAYLYLWAALAWAAYMGLQQFELVPRVNWMKWSHVHYLTVGAFAQVLFWFLPAYVSRKLQRPAPSDWYTWLNFVGLNAGFLLAWYGRGFGNVLLFDVGLYVVWLLVAGLLVVLAKRVMQSDGRAWDVVVGLYLLAVVVFLAGLTYAYGLFAHIWQLPGGWFGLREAHVHANVFGFVGLAIVGTLYDVFPRMAGTELRARSLAKYAFWLLAVGIVPLVVAPWIGSRNLTAAGLVLYAAGYVLYLYSLARTYRAGTGSTTALAVLVAQFWVLAPTLLAPVALYGVQFVESRWVEQGSIHFLFMGWTLPVLLVGALLYARSTPDLRDRLLGGAEPATGRTGAGTGGAGPSVGAPDGVPSLVPGWALWTWNVSVLALGVSFFVQDRAWAGAVFAAGTALLVLVWAYFLVQTVQFRRRTATPVTGD